MKLCKLVFVFYFLLMGPLAWATPNPYVLKEKVLVNLAPPVINKDYFLIEFGYIIDKKIQSWDYPYSAYVTASLFEDWKDQLPSLRAGALGAKGGGLFPLLSWPVFYKVGIGYAKTVLHKNPFFGKEAQTSRRKDMILAELGLVYTRKQMLYGITYQKSNVNYFGRHLFLTVGVTY